MATDMASETKRDQYHFDRNIIILGLGSISRGVIPLLFQNLNIQPKQILVISPSEDHSGIIKRYDIRHSQQRLTRDNFESVLQQSLKKGDVLLNLSVEVESLALIKFCQQHEVLYLDTCIEPWPGQYTVPELPMAERTNYRLRQQVLDYRRETRLDSTAIVTLGANPGLASIFVKQALRRLAADSQIENVSPKSHMEWAALAKHLNIRVIHIAERDTQVSERPKLYDEFVNTWSVSGFASEAMQPAELGWGTHEKHWPQDAEKHAEITAPSIYLRRPGAATLVRSWTPLSGPYHGYLITHGESISIADHLTLSENGNPVYRPTVNYAYYPCDDALLSLHELNGRGGELQASQRILLDDIVAGRDELGVLLMGNEKGVYWFGSRLTIDQARQIAPFNSATSLQVAAGVIGGVLWMIEHPCAGVVEPDDLDDEFIFDAASPYLGEVVGVYGQWTPLQYHNKLFKEPRDDTDPWQFENFRVH